MSLNSEILKKGNRIRPASLPNISCTLGLVVIGYTPYLTKNVSNELKLMLFFLWIISTFFLHPFNGKENGFIVVRWVLLLIVVKLLYCTFGLSANILAPIAGLHIWVVPVAMVYIYNYYSVNEIKLLWLVIISIFFVNLISNIQIGISGGELAFRRIDNEQTNAGSTAFVVGCMLLIPTMWIVFRFCYNRWIKILSFLMMASAGYYIIFLNTRATALLVLLFIVAGFIMQFYEEGKKLDITYFLIRMFLLGVVAFIIITPLINILSDFFSQNNRMLIRLNDMIYVCEGGNIEELGEGSLYARSMLWMTSINTFLDSLPNFLWGIGENLVERDFYSLLRQGVGAHSEFFDLAARYGLIGIYIYYHILKYSFVFIISLARDSAIKNYFAFILVGVMFMGFVNNITDTLTTVLSVFMLIPLSGIMLNYNKL